MKFKPNIPPKYVHNLKIGDIITSKEIITDYLNIYPIPKDKEYIISNIDFIGYHIKVEGFSNWFRLQVFNVLFDDEKYYELLRK